MAKTLLHQVCNANDDVIKRCLFPPTCINYCLKSSAENQTLTFTAHTVGKSFKCDTAHRRFKEETLLAHMKQKKKKTEMQP